MERHTASADPATCQHLRTDHRGSNKFVKKTFCLDCGTHIEVVPRTLLGEEEPALSPEEQVLVDSINEHDMISLEQTVQASERMVTEARRLPSGN